MSNYSKREIFFVVWFNVEDCASLGLFPVLNRTQNIRNPHYTSKRVPKVHTMNNRASQQQSLTSPPRHLHILTHCHHAFFVATGLSQLSVTTNKHSTWRLRSSTICHSDIYLYKHYSLHLIFHANSLAVNDLLQCFSIFQKTVRTLLFHKSFIRTTK